MLFVLTPAKVCCSPRKPLSRKVSIPHCQPPPSPPRIQPSLPGFHFLLNDIWIYLCEGANFVLWGLLSSEEGNTLTMTSICEYRSNVIPGNLQEISQSSIIRSALQRVVRMSARLDTDSYF